MRNTEMARTSLCRKFDHGSQQHSEKERKKEREGGRKRERKRKKEKERKVNCRVTGTVKYHLYKILEI